MNATSDLFESFLTCPTKCFLRSRGEVGSGNEYADWVKSQNSTYRNHALTRLLDGIPHEDCLIDPASAKELKLNCWSLAVNVPVQMENLSTHIPAVERVPSTNPGNSAQFIPMRFVCFNKLTKNDRMLLTFDAFVLSKATNRQVNLGKIIHGDDHAILKVKILNLLVETRKLVGKMTEMLAGDSRPDLLLNRHCSECEFQSQCRHKAMEKDDLSLLPNMKEKERKKFNDEGIFTLNQLSYTFRPRRRPKRLRDKRERYHHALKALAIRQKKIHIVGSPELKIDGTPIYLDVEGLPDREFYYLIGLRIKTASAVVQHSLWADCIADEKKVWSEFIRILTAIEKPVLIHYGSFETTFLKRMTERYGGPPEGSVSAKTLNSSLNLVSFLFAQIYFPTYSNGLKEIGAWLGCKWSSTNPSGAQSIIWRMNWEQSGDPAIKQHLTTYNMEDCCALETLTETVSRLCHPDHRLDLENDADPNDVLAESATSKDSLWGRFTTPIEDFEVINKAARWDFQREKVYIRTDRMMKRAAGRRPIRAKEINKEIDCEPISSCPICQRKSLKILPQRTKILYDIRFSEFGVRRWVIKYHFQVCWCNFCHTSVGVPEAFWPQSIYGRNLVCFVAFKTIELCVPQRTVAQEINRHFGLGVNDSTVNHMKSRAAEYYTVTRQNILAKMLKGKLIHADETPIVLKHKRGYVWVFASFHEVVYFYAETREGDFMQQKLEDFQGVLVSDFYAPYESLPCPQQKCLIHLIRDLNDSLLKYPYDEELKPMAMGFAELLRNIIRTIDHWGLKRRFLSKHSADVDRFYRKIMNAHYRSDAALKWKDRFVKNRNGLFTFLGYDGIPWNNNNAEHAIKAFARLRRAIVGLSTAKGIEEYLILLSICQTCKYSGLDFLDFLRSGKKDIDAFSQRCNK